MDLVESHDPALDGGKGWEWGEISFRKSVRPGFKFHPPLSSTYCGTKCFPVPKSTACADRDTSSYENWKISPHYHPVSVPWG